MSYADPFAILVPLVLIASKIHRRRQQGEVVTKGRWMVFVETKRGASRPHGTASWL